MKHINRSSQALFFTYFRAPSSLKTSGTIKHRCDIDHVVCFSVIGSRAADVGLRVQWDPDV